MRFSRRKTIERLLLICCAAGVCLPPAAAQIKQTRTANNQSTEKLLAEVTAALTNEDLRGAAALVQKVLIAAPNNAAAHGLAGIIADKQNDLPNAEKHFARAAKIAPNQPETRNNYGAVLVKQNKKAQAAAEFAASLKINPNQPSALVNLAQIRFIENDFAAARGLFEKAFALAPDAEIARALVVTALRLNDSRRAAEDYRRYARLINQNPAPGSPRAELGAALLESGLFREAAEELEAAVALDAANVENLILLSRAFLKQKDVKSAGRTLEGAVARGADDARLYAALADVYQAGGYYENAIPAMRLAIEKDPRNDFYRARYGLLLNDTSAPQAAIIRLQEAAKEFPDSAKIRLALGIAQQADGKSVDAQTSFERVLQLEPMSVTALAYLATIYGEKGQYDQAAALYERALAAEEKNATLHYLLADTMLKSARADAARVERHLKRAIEIDAALAGAHLALGTVYTRAGRWQEAAAEFEQAVKFAPDVAEPYYQLGRVLARLKRADESRAALDKFKKLSESQTAQKETTRKELLRRLANTRF